MVTHPSQYWQALKSLSIRILLIILTAGAGIKAASGQENGSSHWRTSCNGPAREGPLTCMASEIVFVRETGKKLIELAVVVGPHPSVPNLRISGPLGFRLPNGYHFEVDGKTLGEVVITHCDQNGCYANLELTPASINLMRGGQTLTVAFSSLNGQRITTPIPLVGFTKAMNLIATHDNS